MFDKDFHYEENDFLVLWPYTFLFLIFIVSKNIKSLLKAFTCVAVLGNIVQDSNQDSDPPPAYHVDTLTTHLSRPPDTFLPF